MEFEDIYYWDSNSEGPILRRCYFCFQSKRVHIKTTEKITLDKDYAYICENCSSGIFNACKDKLLDLDWTDD